MQMYPLVPDCSYNFLHSEVFHAELEWVYFLSHRTCTIRKVGTPLGSAGKEGVLRKGEISSYNVTEGNRFYSYFIFFYLYFCFLFLVIRQQLAPTYQFPFPLKNIRDVSEQSFKPNYT